MRPRQIVTVTVLLLGFAALSCQAAPAASRTLDIYFLDMMGGAATLIVTPLGQSVLIDTGSLEPMHRDADRILAATRLPFCDASLFSFAMGKVEYPEDKDASLLFNPS